MQKKTFYKKLFWVTNSEVVEKIDDNFVMCGTKNWNYYFSRIESIKKSDYEEMKNVELVEFESEKEMFSFWKKLDNFKKIDWSLEHGVPMVLKSA